MGRRTVKGNRKRTWWIVGGATAVVVAAAACGVAALALNVPVEKPLATTPEEREDPAVTSVNVPAVFDSWSSNPAVGDGVQADAGDSGLSARFVVGAEIDILAQTVTLEPNTTYEISATYQSGVADEGLLSIAIGDDKSMELPSAAEWKTVDFEFESGGGGAVPLTITSTAALEGFRLGALTMTSPGGEDVIGNPEFDTFSAASRITNPSLFMESRSAYIGISAPVSEVSWTVTGKDGVEALAGTSTSQSGLALIQLSSLAQGFYTASFAAPEPGLPAGQVNFVVLDDVMPDTLDERLGTIVHLYVPHSVGAGALAQTLGYGNVRVDASWSDNEVAGSYNFPPGIDAAYADFRSRGIHVLPIVAYANASYDNYKTPSSAAGLAAYARYAAATATHYDVDAISIYNEFNHLPFNTGDCGPTPACYMQLLVPAVEAVHAAQPGALIVGPENAHKDDEFLTGLYQAGALNYLDAVTFHPYDYGFEENGSPEFLVESIAQAQARILEYNTDDTPPPIWITELGWTSVLTDSEAQQGDFLTRAQVIALASGVERFYWYDMIKDNQSPTDNIGNFGIVHQATASVPAFEPKPASAAQAIVSRMLAGKAFDAQDDVGDGIYSYRFGSGATSVTAAWSLTPSSVSYQASGPVRVTDATGEYRDIEPIDGEITIELGSSPVFLSSEASEPTLAQ